MDFDFPTESTILGWLDGIWQQIPDSIKTQGEQEVESYVLNAVLGFIPEPFKGMAESFVEKLVNQYVATHFATEDFTMPTMDEIETILESIWSEIPASLKEAGISEAEHLETILLNKVFSILPLPASLKTIAENLLQDAISKFVAAHLQP